MQIRVYMERGMSDVQAGFRKGQETWNIIADAYWVTKKAKEYQNKSEHTSQIIEKSSVVSIVLSYGMWNPPEKWKSPKNLIVLI